MDQQENAASRALSQISHDTLEEPRPSLRELNEQWATRNREPLPPRTREQRRRDHEARHAALIDIPACVKEINAALIDIPACVKEIKRLQGLLLLLLCLLVILLCTLLGRVPLSGG